MDTHAIAAAAVPVLCIDTCSLLDIMRDPTRDTQNPYDHLAAIELVTAAEAGDVALLLAEQVAHEFGEHDKAIQAETEKTLEVLKKHMTRINDISAVYGASKTLDFVQLDGHVARTRALVGRWMAKVEKITPDPAAHSKAFARVNACKAPAKRGKESSKDCLIYETYLEAAMALRNAGVSNPIVYLSSNINDYLTEGGILKPDLQIDFTYLNLVYARNMREAKHRLFPRVTVKP